jgi:hypothetical protein
MHPKYSTDQAYLVPYACFALAYAAVRLAPPRVEAFRPAYHSAGVPSTPNSTLALVLTPYAVHCGQLGVLHGIPYQVFPCYLRPLLGCLADSADASLDGPVA